MSLCHTDVKMVLSEDVNITRITNSSQFWYAFGNQ